MSKCRVCNYELYEEPLMILENMPKSAQYFPDEDSIENEKGIDLEICQCSGCGQVQLKNEPVKYFKEVIRAVDISDEMKDFRLKQFEGIIKRFSLKGKKIIEIGCGRGEYLSLMNQFEVSAFGLEYSNDLVKQCQEKGLKVSQGFIDSNVYSLKNAPFDAFYIFSFLEHLPAPNATLRGIYNNIAEEGIGIVEVPNFDMILEKKLFSEFITDHIFYFTKETLSKILSINGFEVLDCSEIWHDYIISATVRKRKALDIKHFHAYQDLIKKEINEYISRFGENKAAIWGAGHQALAVISLTDLSERIKYVVDSAVFKQGKYTPATHIPITAPEMLDNDPVDAVIIIAGSYSDEVAKIIQKKFDRILNIAVLRDYGLEIVKS